MGLLRLMGNKADVVKGLAKRCNENWSVAPKSDIVRSLPVHDLYKTLTSAPSFLERRVSISPISKYALTSTCLLIFPNHSVLTSLVVSGSSGHDDTELESLREDSVPFALELPRPDLDRHDDCQQRDERRSVEDDCARNYSHVRPLHLMVSTQREPDG